MITDVRLYAEQMLNSSFSAHEIHRLTGVNYTSISRLRNGYRDLNNLSYKNVEAIALFAIKLYNKALNLGYLVKNDEVKNTYSVKNNVFGVTELKYYRSLDKFIIVSYKKDEMYQCLQFDTEKDAINYARFMGGCAIKNVF